MSRLERMQRYSVCLAFKICISGPEFRFTIVPAPTVTCLLFCKDLDYFWYIAGSTGLVSWIFVFALKVGVGVSY